MKNLPLLLAWRYLLGSRQERSISAMIFICFLGILIGSCALALVASVMNGFEKVTHEKMQGIHSQLIIHADGNLINTRKINEVLNKEFPEVAAWSPSGSGQALIQNQETRDVHDVVAIKGIDPDYESMVSVLEKKIVKALEGEKKLSSLLRHNHVIIGQRLADIINVRPGQPITLYVSTEESIRGRKIKLDTKPAIVAGTFKTGIDEFDAAFLFCSLDFLEKLFPDSGATQIGLRLKPNVNESNTIKRLKKRLRLNVISWKELYPALVSALKLEKYSMFLILALITLVASMNIISLVFMQITQKRADIAILKAMGLSNARISRIFLLVGMGIAFIGSVCGLGLAFIGGFILEHYPFISLPDAYYVSHLPSRMTVPIFVIVFLVVMALSFLSTWLTTRSTKRINISRVLRFEG